MTSKTNARTIHVCEKDWISFQKMCLDKKISVSKKLRQMISSELKGANSGN